MPLLLAVVIAFPIVSYYLSNTKLLDTYQWLSVDRQPGKMLLESTYLEHNLLAVLVTESQRSADADLKDVHIYF